MLEELGTYDGMSEMAIEGNPELTNDCTPEALNDGMSETSLDGIDEDDIIGLGVKGGMIGSFVGILVRVCERKELSNQYLVMIVQLFHITTYMKWIGGRTIAWGFHCQLFTWGHSQGCQCRTLK